MNILYLLIAVSVVLILSIAVILLWAVRSGQYEDLEGPAWRILADDDSVQPRPEELNRGQSHID